MRREGTWIQRREEKSAPPRGREREEGFGPSSVCFSVPGPVPGASGEAGALLVLPEVLAPALGPPSVLFHGLSFPGLLATAILDSLSLF